MAKMPRGNPRSVPDPAGDQYDDEMQRKRLKAQAAENAKDQNQAGSVGHPGFAESLIPVWGSGREAVADFQEGDYAGAAINGALAASDLFLAGTMAKGILKGGLYGVKLGRKVVLKAQWPTVSRYMRDEKLLQPNQIGHHWLIPQNGWGKKVPNIVKNQPWNIKAMPEGPIGPEMHGRIHGRYKGKPRYTPVERYVYGTPTWSKVATADAVGHPVAATKAQLEGRK